VTQTHLDEREAAPAPHELPPERERLEGRRPEEVDAEPHHAKAGLAGGRLRRARDHVLPAHSVGA